MGLGFMFFEPFIFFVDKYTFYVRYNSFVGCQSVMINHLFNNFLLVRKPEVKFVK